MENARVGIFDDLETIRKLFRINLEREGHIVIAEAASVEEALDVISSLGPHDIDVILLDGNFTKGRKDSAEGAEIARAARSRLGDVAIIGISGAAEIAEATKNMSKLDFDSIRDYISRL